ncbi:MAG: hypothetical protein WAK61_20695 [Leclercia sp.]
MRPRRASMRVAPGYRKRFGDFQPDQGAAASSLFFLIFFVALIICEAASGNGFSGLSPQYPRSIFLLRLQNQASGLEPWLTLSMT